MIKDLHTQIETRKAEHAATIEANKQEILLMKQEITAANTEAEQAIVSGNSESYAQAMERKTYAEKRLSHLQACNASTAYNAEAAAAMDANLRHTADAELLPLYRRMKEHLAAGVQLYSEIEAVLKAHQSAAYLLASASPRGAVNVIAGYASPAVVSCLTPDKAHLIDDLISSTERSAAKAGD